MQLNLISGVDKITVGGPEPVVICARGRTKSDTGLHHVTHFILFNYARLVRPQCLKKSLKFISDAVKRKENS